MSYSLSWSLLSLSLTGRPKHHSQSWNLQMLALSGAICVFSENMLYNPSQHAASSREDSSRAVGYVGTSHWPDGSSCMPVPDSYI